MSLRSEVPLKEQLQRGYRQRLKDLARGLALPSLLIAVALAHALTLNRFPAPFVDEAWMASRAWGWLQTGINLGPLDSVVYQKLDGFGTFMPVLPTLIHALAIRLLGFSLPALRLASLAFAVGLLAAVYRIMVELTGSRRAGIIAVLLASTSLAAFQSMHLVRPDIFVAALGYGAIALHLMGRRTGRSAFDLLAGLCVGAAFEIHVNAIIFAPVLASMFLIQDGLTTLRGRRFWAFAAGLSTGLAAYAWLHVIRYPETYAIMGGGFSRTHLPPLLSTRLSTLLASLYETAALMLWQTLGRLVAIPVVALALWRLRSKGSRQMMLMSLVAFLSFALAIRNKQYYYAILLTPLFDLLLAVWLDQQLAGKTGITFSWRMSKAFTNLVVTASIGLAVVVVTTTPAPGEQHTVASYIRRSVPDTGSIMASQVYWFDLMDVPYLSWQELISPDPHSETYLNDTLNALRPKVFVIDGEVRQFILADNADVPYSGFGRYRWDRRLPAETLNAFLACRGQLAYRIETQVYSTVEIYVIDWEKPIAACS